MPSTTTRNVRFGDYIRLTIHPIEMQSSEASWYTKEEYKLIHQQALQELKTYGVSRGLELCHEALSNAETTQRMNHGRSILSLQEEHSENGMQDARGLQALSAALSKEAATQAQARAAEDAIEAFTVHTAKSAYMKATSPEQYAQTTRRRRILPASRCPSAPVLVVASS